MYVYILITVLYDQWHVPVWGLTERITIDYSPYTVQRYFHVELILADELGIHVHVNLLRFRFR